MFRILLVEDVPNTLEELRELLKEVFLDSQIEASSTVEEGLQKINLAAQPFDVAILDFKLPTRKGENPEIDESLCIEIEKCMPGTLVIHITSYHEDQKVAQHILDHHSDHNAPRVELIAKSAYWPETLLGEMKAYLYGRHIEEQLDKLFGKQTGAAERARKADSFRGSLTHELAALTRDISTYWRDLDETTQARIRTFFNVNEIEEQVRVSLLVAK